MENKVAIKPELHGGNIKQISTLAMMGTPCSYYNENTVGPMKPGLYFYKWLANGPSLKLPIAETIFCTSTHAKMLYTDSNGIVKMKKVDITDFDERGELLNEFLSICVKKSAKVIGRPLTMVEKKLDPLLNRVVAVKKAANWKSSVTNRVEVLLPYPAQAAIQTLMESPTENEIIQRYVRVKGRNACVFRVFWKSKPGAGSNIVGYNISNNEEFVHVDDSIRKSHLIMASSRASSVGILPDADHNNHFSQLHTGHASPQRGNRSPSYMHVPPSPDRNSTAMDDLFLEHLEVAPLLSDIELGQCQKLQLASNKQLVSTSTACCADESSGQVTGASVSTITATKVSEGAIHNLKPYLEGLAWWIQCSMQREVGLNLETEELVCDFVRDCDGNYHFTQLKGFKITPLASTRVQSWIQLKHQREALLADNEGDEPANIGEGILAGLTKADALNPALMVRLLGEVMKSKNMDNMGEKCPLCGMVYTSTEEVKVDMEWAEMMGIDAYAKEELVHLNTAYGCIGVAPKIKAAKAKTTNDQNNNNKTKTNTYQSKNDIRPSSARSGNSSHRSGSRSGTGSGLNDNSNEYDWNLSEGTNSNSDPTDSDRDGDFHSQHLLSQERSEGDDEDNKEDEDGMGSQYDTPSRSSSRKSKSKSKLMTPEEKNKYAEDGDEVDGVYVQLPAFGYELSMKMAYCILQRYRDSYMPLTPRGRTILTSYEPNMEVTSAGHSKARDDATRKNIHGTITSCYRCFEVLLHYCLLQEAGDSLYSNLGVSGDPRLGLNTTTAALLGLKNSNKSDNNNSSGVKSKRWGIGGSSSPTSTAKSRRERGERGEVLSTQPRSQDPSYFLNAARKSLARAAAEEEHHYDAEYPDSYYNNNGIPTSILKRPSSAPVGGRKTNGPSPEKSIAASVLTGRASIARTAATSTGRGDKMKDGLHPLGGHPILQSVLNAIPKHTQYARGVYHTTDFARGVSQWRLFMAFQYITSCVGDADEEDLQPVGCISYSLGQQRCVLPFMNRADNKTASEPMVWVKQCRVHTFIGGLADVKEHFTKGGAGSVIKGALYWPSEDNAVYSNTDASTDFNSRPSSASAAASRYKKNPLRHSTSSLAAMSTTEGGNRTLMGAEGASTMRRRKIQSECEFEIPLIGLNWNDADGNGREKIDIRIPLQSNVLGQGSELHISIAVVVDDFISSEVADVDCKKDMNVNIYWPPSYFHPRMALPEAWLGMLTPFGPNVTKQQTSSLTNGYTPGQRSTLPISSSVKAAATTSTATSTAIAPGRKNGNDKPFAHNNSQKDKGLKSKEDTARIRYIAQRTRLLRKKLAHLASRDVGGPLDINNLPPPEAPPDNNFLTEYDDTHTNNTNTRTTNTNTMDSLHHHHHHHTHKYLHTPSQQRTTRRLLLCLYLFENVAREEETVDVAELMEYFENQASILTREVFLAADNNRPKRLPLIYHDYTQELGLAMSFPLIYLSTLLLRCAPKLKTLFDMYGEQSGSAGLSLVAYLHACEELFTFLSKKSGHNHIDTKDRTLGALSYLAGTDYDNDEIHNEDHDAMEDHDEDTDTDTDSNATSNSDDDGGDKYDTNTRLSSKNKGLSSTFTGKNSEGAGTGIVDRRRSRALSRVERTTLVDSLLLMNSNKNNSDNKDDAGNDNALDEIQKREKAAAALTARKLSIEKINKTDKSKSRNSSMSMIHEKTSTSDQKLQAGLAELSFRRNHSLHATPTRRQSMSAVSGTSRRHSTATVGVRGLRNASHMDRVSRVARSIAASDRQLEQAGVKISNSISNSNSQLSNKMTAQEQKDGVIRARNRSNTLSGDSITLENLAEEARSGAPPLSHLFRLECDLHGETHFLAADMCCIRCEQEWQRQQLQKLQHQHHQQQQQQQITATNTITTNEGSQVIQNEYDFEN